MILNDFTEPRLKFGRDKLDAVLAELCSLVIAGQRDNPDFFGMVAAAVIDPRGRLVTGVNYLYGNGRVHAERAAIDRYEEEYGELPRGSIVVTTLSPCSQDTHDNRHGASCTAFLNSKHIKIAYCGYQDPTQDAKNKFIVLVTDNSRIEQLCQRFADTFLDEDFDPNQRPPGPEFPPTMPAGTVKVGVSDVYDWYKLGQHISNLKGLGHHDFGQGPPSTIISFGSEEAEHKYLKDLEKLGLPTVDIDPLDPNQPKGMPRQATDPTYNVDENFADGKVKGKSRPGRVKRAGASCKGSVADLRSKAKNSSGERAKMYHWCANMKSGRRKTNEETSKQILSYIKKIHPRGEFTIDQSVTDHPEWELINVPLSQLHIESDDVSPYGQINWIDYDHVDTITAQDIKAKPIVVDNAGWIIDGNHRAVAARDMGMTSIPAYVPAESEEDDDQETYAQHMARVNREREQGIQEVIHHPGIKTKHADTSGLVNRGEPVPAGKEKRLLGTKVGNLGELEVYRWDKGTDSAYSVYDPKTRISQMTISGHNKAHHFEIFGIYGGPKSPIRAADLYAWLVKKLGLTLVSDKYQSPGGQRVWQELEQRYGRSVNVYAFNMRTNQPINTGADDPESTHGHRGDIAQNVRLVAAPK